MFTIAKIKDGGTYLEKHLSANDYYAEGEKIIGHWQGKGAERLGLANQILPGDAAFAALRDNRNPNTGEKLTPRDGEHRVRFFDFQCSAQKSVSIMAVTLGDERLLNAHDRASATAFAELEKFAACQANTVTKRNTRNTGNVIAAKFRHTSSRALDPQVHTHFVVANATWDEKTKSWRALTEYEMVRAIRYAGKVYQNELARLCLSLGYVIEPARNERGIVTGFEIAGVSPAIRERFSKRRSEVEDGIAKFVKKHGRAPSTVEIHVITVETRSAKLAEVTTPAVLRNQREQLSADEEKVLTGLKEQALQCSPREPARAILSQERDSLHASVRHLYERQSVVPAHEILAESLNQNLGYNDLSLLKSELERSKLCKLESSSGPMGLAEVYTTRSGLRLEKWAVAFVERTQGQHPALGPQGAVLSERLSAEQRAALEKLLGNRDQVACLRGAAGVGKTTLLVELNRALAEQKVWHVAPTASAVDTLRREGLCHATTVADFLQNKVTKEASALRNAVWIVDEASLASNRDGAALLQAADVMQARVVFIGDTRQHTSVEAGDFLRVLEAHSKLARVEVTDIRRQVVKEYRDAVKSMAAGHVQAGIEKLSSLGWIKEVKADYVQAAAKTYAEVVASKSGSVLCVTPTWAENHAVTEAIRSELKAQGLLQPGESITVHDPLNWTKTQKANAASYEPGMVLRFSRSTHGFARGECVQVVDTDSQGVRVCRADRVKTMLPLRSDAFEVNRPRTIEVSPGDQLLIRANDRAQGFINGERVMVSAVQEGQIALSDGGKLDPTKFASFAHGYAVTSHKSQSQTVDKVIVVASQLTAKSAYVACSRGRQQCTVFTPDAKALLAKMGSGDRVAALDIISLVEPNAARNSFDSVMMRSEAWMKIARDNAIEWLQQMKRQLARTWSRRAHTLDELTLRSPSTARQHSAEERDRS
ncbi:MAG: MobF family relaxase [Nibricoccus sp.]